MSLIVVPVTITEAKAYIRMEHRHAPVIVGGLFAVGVAEKPGPRPLVGVAIVGRPSRMLADGWTCQISRLATDGHRNACSLLYGAAWRAARAVGYRRLRTYTLTSESGASLRAIGARELGLTEGRSWSRSKRARHDKHELGPRRIWELAAANTVGPLESDYHEHVAGDQHAHAYNGPHSHGGVSSLIEPPR